MKKGFTLIELLTIIVIIAIIGLIAVTAVNRTIRNNRINLYCAQIENIVKAAEIWVNRNALNDLPPNISMQDLQAAGLLENEILDPRTNEEFANIMIFIIDNGHGIFSFMASGVEEEC